MCVFLVCFIIGCKSIPKKLASQTAFLGVGVFGLCVVLVFSIFCSVFFSRCLLFICFVVFPHCLLFTGLASDIFNIFYGFGRALVDRDNDSYVLVLVC